MLPSTVHFSGSYSPGSSGGSLALYGWSMNPLVEYYVMEDFASPCRKSRELDFSQFQW
jgi:hypothetical protein